MNASFVKRDKTPYPAMHRFRSRHAVRRFKAVAWLLVVKWLLAVASVPLMAYGLMDADTKIATLGLCVFVFCGIITLTQWAVATQARCPLCMVPPIAIRKCATNRSAKRLFGSQALRVAVSAILLNRFLCPYCGESSLLEARGSRPRRPPAS